MNQEILWRFAQNHDFLGSQAGARNRCIDASVWFLQDLGIPRELWSNCMRDNLDEPGVYEEHHWVCVGGVCVDWTARQYDPQAPFPKVWHEEVRA